MILRRLTKHIDEQNWFAVGLDMLVVVVGIFVGLQISNWNTDRQNITKGYSYLNRIADELEQDIRFFDTSLRINRDSVERGNFILQTLENENLAIESPTKFIRTIERLGGTFRTNVSDNTFEEIKFSGNLELITDEKLRNKIADYYDFIEMEQNWSHIRIMMETTYFTRSAGILKPDQIGRSPRENEGIYTAEEAQEVYQVFKNKASLIEWIPSVIWTKKQSILFDQEAQRRAKELHAEIRGEPIQEQPDK
ncbi:MAG: hypothetical protein JKY84_14645 [Emcibacteraceae bacterium]|nr:hypothetical protein [Emcibacteraceae bacterium]